MEKVHLVGIGGTGMSALAQLLVREGFTVSGSDRSQQEGLFTQLRGLGVKLFPQDGSGIVTGTKTVIISRAIEDDNPELLKARELGIPVCYRQAVLKEIVGVRGNIAVAGTSGKTTVVGMIGTIFKDITLLNGGVMNNYSSPVYFGKDPLICVETDESEGDLKGYHPLIGVVTNIGSDHLSEAELIKVYQEFAAEVKKTLIVNNDSDCGLEHKNKFSFGINNTADFQAENIRLFPEFSQFTLRGKLVKLPVPGQYNVYNALASLSAAYVYGISLTDAVAGLGKFRGIRQRFQLLGETKGIKVVCDYAHNPDKIRAALQTAKLNSGRIIVVYQPHGFRPTKMFLRELAAAFADNLNSHDFLYLTDIYYAGGTVSRDVSVEDLVTQIRKRNRELWVEYLQGREELTGKITSLADTADLILIMGARDHTLLTWANNIFEMIKG